MGHFWREAGVVAGILLGVATIHLPGCALPVPRVGPPDPFVDCSTPPDNPIDLASSFPSFNSDRLDQQVRLYHRYLTIYGVPDVLIVGSSRALQGVDPAVLQETLAAQGKPLRIYNFSINGATARVVELMLRQVLLPEQLPRLLVWADGSRAFNSARRDLTYTGIVASEGYQKLLRGDRPIPARQWVEPAAVDPLCQETPLSLRAPDASAAQTPLPASDLNGLGFQSVVTRYDPATYFRRFPRVTGRYDDNYTPFRLGGVQTEATQRIATLARQRQIPLVFVNLPLSREHLNDRTRRRAEQQFRLYMKRLANQQGFLFYDLSQQWGDRSNYFADPSHLNREGAEAVARHLATQSNLPWSRWFPRAAAPQN